MARKFCALLFLLFLLSGCQSAPEPPTQAAEPSVPTLLELAEPWDDQGLLKALPYDVPMSRLYTASTGFNGKLLLWGSDDHRLDQAHLYLCVLDPVTGALLGQREFHQSAYQNPQVVGQYLYLCDHVSGQIYELDETLSTVHQWKLEPQEGRWFLGAGHTLYHLYDGRLTRQDLDTGEVCEVFTQDTNVMNVNVLDGYTCLVDYFDQEKNVFTYQILELSTGTLLECPFDALVSGMEYAGGTWLTSLYSNSSIYYLGTAEAPLRLALDSSSVCLLPQGYLLESMYDDNALRLYRPDGAFVSGCQLSETGIYYLSDDPIFTEDGTGCFLQVSSYNGDRHLLYWDLTVEVSGQDLPVEPLPQLSTMLRSLRARADALEAAYGVRILMGEECDTEFEDFAASQTTDWELLRQELDEMEAALSSYPQGFFSQLRYGSIRELQIQLVQELTPTSGQHLGGSYSAFAVDRGGYYLLVMDVGPTDEGTYYHEFSHVIDKFLEYDSWQRTDALFSESAWEALNPEWFSYTYDYQAEYYTFETHGDWFIDGYSTTYPTEDRARILEYATNSRGGWMFLERPGLQAKLQYYCACIRDAFDTTGWPEVTAWEEAIQ